MAGVEKNPIPEDKLRYSTFDQLRDRAQRVLRVELERGIRSRASTNKAVTFYAACINEQAIEAAGYSFRVPQLATCGAAQSQAASLAARQEHGQ